MENTSTKPHTTKPLVIYFILAYALSWVIGVPLALAKQGMIAPLFPEWFHYFVGYGPALAALLTSWATEGTTGVKKLWSRITHWQIGPIWWLIALSPLLIGMVVVLVMSLTPTPVKLAKLGNIHYLPPLGIGALFVWLLTFGIGEEIGWRGFALPQLQQKHHALVATIILTFFWALWHLPQFFYLFEPSIAIGWALGLFAGAIVFTWLFNSTNGSVLAVAIFHGCFNFMSASSAGGGVLAAVVSTFVMIWAVVLLFLYKPANLSTRPRFAA